MICPNAIRYPMLVLLTMLTAGCTFLGQSVSTTPAPIPPTETVLAALRPPATATPVPATATDAADPAPITPMTALEEPVTAELLVADDPSSTLDSSMTADPSATPHPSITAEPSPTPVRSRTVQPSATPRPSPTSVPSPTPDAVATLLAGETPRVHSTLLSPDGRYRAEVIIYGCDMGEEGDAYEIIRVIDTTDGREHIIADQYHGCMGLGWAGLEVLLWDPGNRFLYYTPAREGSPDGGCEAMGRPMFRADASNWSVTDMGGSVASPDGERYAAWQDRDLVIWTIDGREIGRTPPAVDLPILGLPAWSPDGTSLAYFQLNESLCAGGSQIETAIIIVDSETLEQHAAIESGSLPIFELGWLDFEHILLRGFDKSWILDVATDTISPGP